jgi:hypothetical protein
MASLEDGERGLAAQQRLHRVGQPGQVVVDELGLEGEGRGGHHDRAVHEQRGHQVGQRLAGAGAGLHEQVLAATGGRLDGLRHLPLAGPVDAARDAADRRREQLG